MIFLYSLFCFQIRKREKENWLPYSNFPLWNRRMKNERTVYTTRDCFPFILFSSCNRKNENGYNGSYFYFSFFVWGLEKRKRMLRYPFSIFYYEIEKRKTKGRYIHGPPLWGESTFHWSPMDLPIPSNRTQHPNLKMDMIKGPVIQS